MNAHKLIENIEHSIEIEVNHRLKEYYIKAKETIMKSIKFEFDFLDNNRSYFFDNSFFIKKLPFNLMYCEATIKLQDIPVVVSIFIGIDIDDTDSEGLIMGNFFVGNRITDVYFRENGNGFEIGYNFSSQRQNEIIDTGAESFYRDILNLFSNIIHSLNGSNITTETHQPSAKLNKKRLKRGKLPLFEYKTLVLPGTHAPAQEHQGGTHASPRWHVRRGHIRRLQNGNEIWVESCSVGSINAGIINKDYRVELGGIQ